MMENLTQARSYAKAIFALALREQQLQLWLQLLTGLAEIITECKARGILNNPEITRDMQLEFFCNDLKQFSEAANLIRLLINYKHLVLLPDIAKVYQQLLYAYENKIAVKIVAATGLAAEQKAQIQQTLEQKFKHKVLLEETIDPSLLGGAKIYVGDRVIDGSLKGQLEKLRQALTC